MALTREEDTYRTAGDETGEATRVTFGEWRRLFGCATTWGMIIGFFGVVYLTWVYSAWLPGYLEIQRHMSIPHTGLIAAIPFFGGTVGSIQFYDLAAGAVATPSFATFTGAVQNLTLSADDLAAIEAAVPADAVAGERYDAAQVATLDSEH